MDRELALALIKSAKSDLELAEDLFNMEKYYYAVVFFSQQSAEKISKAALACEGIVNVRRHDVSGLLPHYLHERGEDFMDMIKDIQFLEAHVTKSRV
ncbi:MAG: HEPN domain-containing protein [Methanosarcinales archaeon]